MTEWETDKTQGLVVGIGLMVAIFLVDVGVIWLAVDRARSTGVVSIGTLIGYWLYGLARSSYSLDRNALVIHWGPAGQVVPARQIERVLTGDEIEGRIQFYGALWHGHCVGYGEVSGVGPTLFYGTVPPRRMIYAATPGLAYGVSPADREGFLESLHTRLQMGPTQIVEQASKRPSVLDWPIWQDHLGLALLAGGILGVIVLIGLLCFWFPALPPHVPLHFDATGTPDRLVPRGQSFIVPLIGLLALLLNGALGALAYRYERLASYLLWGGGVLVQFLTWVAVIGILRQA
jgi:hypothetical protein